VSKFKPITLLCFLLLCSSGCLEKKELGLAQGKDSEVLLPAGKETVRDNNYPVKNENKETDESKEPANESNEVENEKQEVEKDAGENKKACCLYFVHNNRGNPCLAEKEFLNEMKQEHSLEVREILTTSSEGFELAQHIAGEYGVKIYSVPWTFVCENSFLGFGESTKAELEKAIEDCKCECIETGGETD